MPESTPAYRLHYMRPSDIEQVVAIDGLSFDPPWTADSYQFEVQRSSCSYMVVLEERTSLDTPSLWQTISAQIKGDDAPLRERIIGYGGLWKIQEEAHISTIATHPDYRGRGYGEALLMAMVQRSRDLRAQYIVLEVRVSNHIAQRLYRKYGFEVTRTKPNYYSNNGEDAYEMRLDFGNQQTDQRLDDLYGAMLGRLMLEDLYSRVPHSRLGA